VREEGWPTLPSASLPSPGPNREPHPVGGPGVWPGLGGGALGPAGAGTPGIRRKSA